MTIRSAALDWFSRNYPSHGAKVQAIRTSKFFRPDESWTRAPAWWVQIPLVDVERGLTTHILLEAAPGDANFRYLRVPASFLRENLKRFALVNGQRINLFLSAEARDELTDRRGTGIQFAGFEQGDAQSPRRGGDAPAGDGSGIACRYPSSPAQLTPKAATRASSSVAQWVATVCSRAGVSSEYASFADYARQVCGW